MAVSIVTREDIHSWDVFLENRTQPIAGKKELRKDTLLFRPLIPFQPGMTYEIRLDSGINHSFRIPERKTSVPWVVQIYPTADSLPSNLLKFYISFSEPMAEGNPYPYLHLVSAEGDTLQQAFLNQLPALWNEDQTILSLWLDPGRIKRDLELNKRLGNPMEAGQIYQLVVGSGFKSQKGTSLQKEIQKSFTTTSADRNKPDLANWNMELPKAGSTVPLKITFNEPMDYLSTRGRISVLRDGKPVEGTVRLLPGENKWEFIPYSLWEKGAYTIRADARMEDLAGNNLNRLFDRDVKKEARIDKTYHTRLVVIN